jgi:hypothetical protein
MDAELQTRLFERYPTIFAERTLPKTETAMCWGITTGDGWFHLIDGLCARLQWETDHGGAPQVVATQVKEKFGRLCFYRHEASERQLGMIDLASELATRTCDVCGAPGRTVTLGRHPVATRCESHDEASPAHE